MEICKFCGDEFYSFIVGEFFFPPLLNLVTFEEVAQNYDLHLTAIAVLFVISFFLPFSILCIYVPPYPSCHSIHNHLSCRAREQAHVTVSSKKGARQQQQYSFFLAQYFCSTPSFLPPLLLLDMDGCCSDSLLSILFSCSYDCFT